MVTVVVVVRCSDAGRIYDVDAANDRSATKPPDGCRSTERMRARSLGGTPGWRRHASCSVVQRSYTVAPRDDTTHRPTNRHQHSAPRSMLAHSHLRHRSAVVYLTGLTRSNWSDKNAKFLLKFHVQRTYVTEPLLRYGYFAIFQNGDRRRLGFLKFRNFNGREGKEGQTASVYQISWRSVKRLLRYGEFSIFPNGVAAVLSFQNFKFLTVERVKRVNASYY